VLVLSFKFHQRRLSGYRYVMGQNLTHAILWPMACTINSLRDGTGVISALCGVLAYTALHYYTCIECEIADRPPLTPPHIIINTRRRYCTLSTYRQFNGYRLTLWVCRNFKVKEIQIRR